jgi:hypothetical protein
MKLTILILTAAFLMLAQDAPKPEDDAALKVQLATAQAQSAYWQARAEFYKSQWLTLAGQLTDEHAQPQLLQRVNCGEYDLKTDQQGVPTCIAKPVPPVPVGASMSGPGQMAGPQEIKK